MTGTRPARSLTLAVAAALLAGTVACGVDDASGAGTGSTSTETIGPATGVPVGEVLAQFDEDFRGPAVLTGPVVAGDRRTLDDLADGLRSNGVDDAAMAVDGVDPADAVVTALSYDACQSPEVGWVLGDGEVTFTVTSTEDIACEAPVPVVVIHELPWDDLPDPVTFRWSDHPPLATAEDRVVTPAGSQAVGRELGELDRSLSPDPFATDPAVAADERGVEAMADMVEAEGDEVLADAIRGVDPDGSIVTAVVYDACRSPEVGWNLDGDEVTFELVGTIEVDCVAPAPVLVVHEFGRAELPDPVVFVDRIDRVLATVSGQVVTPGS